MSDVFRQEYKVLDQLTKDNIFIIKAKAQELMNEFESTSLNQSIDMGAMALARMNLEQAVMWAIKAIT